MGETISEPDFRLDFLIGLDNLQELTIDNAQVRDLSPLQTLKGLRKLTLSNIVLRGGGVFDLAPLASSTTLAEVRFAHLAHRCLFLRLVSVQLSLRGTAAVDDIDPLASIATLKKLDLTGCKDGLSRTAFRDNTSLEFVDERGR